MKNLLILFMFTLLVATTVQTFSQSPPITPTDSTVVVTPDNPPATNNQATATLIMTALAIIGAIFRIVYQTIKGVNNQKNNTPENFDFGYWIKDNLLPKVTVILTFILTLSAPFKLPDSTIGIVILGILAFVAGYFIDYVSDIFGGLAKKQAIKINIPKKS